LVGGIELLRVDATTCGGITGAIEAVNVAAAAGRTVLPHVFAPLHVHLACAFPNVEGVELIPEESGADPLPAFLLDRPTIRDGTIAAAETPGVGMLLDWGTIERLARRTVLVSPEM
jgi:L-alanine-DL-glutamate epimerase-like enolase superfamily enzyme